MFADGSPARCVRISPAFVVGALLACLLVAVSVPANAAAGAQATAPVQAACCAHLGERAAVPASLPWLFLSTALHLPPPGLAAPPVLYALPLERTLQQRTASGQIVFAKGARGPFESIYYRVWARGGLDPTAPSVRLLLRPTNSRWRNQGAQAPWQVQVQAQQLQEPYEGMVRASVKRRLPGATLTAAFVGIDAELPPLLAPRLINTRKVRRSGLALAGQFGRLKQGGLRPLLAQPCCASGAPRSGVRLGYSGHAWLRQFKPPTLDGRVSLDGILKLAGTGDAGEALGYLWGRMAFRAVVGGGTEEPTVRVGGLVPGVYASKAHGPRHLLRESILGYEDLACYSNRVTSTEAGVALTGFRGGKIAGFWSAGRVDCRGQRGRWLRATGVVAQRTQLVGAWPVTVSYQLAHRQGGTQGAWLHLLTAGV